eukprot:tig00000254_g22536.t1
MNPEAFAHMSRRGSEASVGLLPPSARAAVSSGAADTDIGGEYRSAAAAGDRNAMDALFGPRLPIPLPDSFERLVMSRLDRLSAQPALVVKLLSALGTCFDYGLALYALEGSAPDADVPHALTEIEKHGLIKIVKQGNSLFHVRFLQSSVVTLLYSLLGKDDRVPVHLRAALYYERTSARRSDVAARTAHHFIEAGMPDKALPHLDACAEEALRMGAFAEALSLARRAIGIEAGVAAAQAQAQARPAGSSTRRGGGGAENELEEAAAGAVAGARRWQLAASALLNLGMVDDAVQHLERCVALLKAPGIAGGAGSGFSLGTAARLLGAALRGPGPGRVGAGLDQAGSTGGPGGASFRVVGAGADRDAPPAGPATARLRLRRERGLVLGAALATYFRCLMQTGDTARAVHAAAVQCGQGDALSGCDPGTQAEACAQMYTALQMLGVSARRSRPWIGRGLELCGGPGAPAAALGAVLAAEIAGAIARGELAEAERLCLKAAPVPPAARPARLPALSFPADRSELMTAPQLRRRSAFQALGEVQYYQGLVRQLRGDPADAERVFERATRDARRANNRTHFLWCLTGWANVRLSQDAADAELEEALLEAATAEALGAAEALGRHQRAPLAGRLVHWPLALGPTCLLADTLCALVAAHRREEERARELLERAVPGYPRLSAFVAATAAAGGRTSEPARRLTSALRGVVAELRGGARRAAVLRAPAAYFEGRLEDLFGAPRRARELYRTASDEAGRCGMALFGELARARGGFEPAAATSSSLPSAERRPSLTVDVTPPRKND